MALIPLMRGSALVPEVRTGFTDAVRGYMTGRQAAQNRELTSQRLQDLAEDRASRAEDRALARQYRQEAAKLGPDATIQDRLSLVSRFGPPGAALNAATTVERLKIAQAADARAAASAAQTAADRRRVRTLEAETQALVEGMLRERGVNPALARIPGIKKRLLEDVFPEGQDAPAGFRWTADGETLEKIPGGPADKPPKRTEGQLKAAEFADAAFDAARILDKSDIVTAAMDPQQRLLSNVAGAVGASSYVTSPEFQQFDQASRAFINALLRRESGAVISDQEFANARKQYLPAPGDSPQVLQQKARNRRRRLDALKRSAGEGYEFPTFVEDEPLPTQEEIDAELQRRGIGNG